MLLFFKDLPTFLKQDNLSMQMAYVILAYKNPFIFQYLTEIDEIVDQQRMLKVLMFYELFVIKLFNDEKKKTIINRLTIKINHISRFIFTYLLYLFIIYFQHLLLKKVIIT